MTATPLLVPDPASVVRDALAGLASAGSLGRDALLDAVTALGEVQAVLDGVKLRVAGELENRSTLLGVENPVTLAGHGTAAAVLAERWQISTETARRYCSVGEATGSRLSLTGEVLTPRFPALAAATGAPVEDPSPNDDGDGDKAGWVSVEQAAVIVRELAKAADRCPTEDLHAAEQALVHHAPSLTVPELRALAGQLRDRLDQDGIEPREERQRRRRSLTISTTADGMTRIDWLLDPESAGYVVSAVDAVVTAELRTVRFRDNTSEAVPGSEAGVDEGADPRTLAQLRSDAAVDVFRHAAGCDRTAVDGVPPVTVLVRIGLDELRTGVGTAEIDGMTAPVSAGTVRRMAADAGIIPVVLGADSEVLDLGRTRRLFSTAQRRALAERDGGCAWPGCPHPPSYTEAHHIRWWNAHGGATDLDNGVLLCSSHHHRVHDDGWQIHVREQVPYFTPPGHVDPHRRPRPGGRVRLRAAA
jgi:hypothetical protein